MEKKMKVHSQDLVKSKKLLNVPLTFPFKLLNEKQAFINHNQSLNKLNERGGMSIVEILNNIDCKRLEFRAANQSDVDRLNKILASVTP